MLVGVAGAKMANNNDVAELESVLSHHERAVKAKEKENRWMRPIGFVARLIVYAEAHEECGVVAGRGRDCPCIDVVGPFYQRLEAEGR
jgi:hypothetical protein